MDLSIILPCYNEEESLNSAIPVIFETLKELEVEFELVVVDDGSTDDSMRILQTLQSKYSQIRILRLVRNFGHQSAMLAGIHASKGEWVVTMDIDLQDPPSVLKEMWKIALRNRRCLVLTRRSSRDHDTWFKKRSANLFYRILSIFNSNSIKDSGDFRLMHQCVTSHLKSLKSDSAPLRLYLPWLGIPYSLVEYERAPRISGTTKYTLGKMIKLSVESYLAFGIKPLKLVAATGVVLGCFSAAIGIFEIIVWLQGKAIPGFSTVVLPLLFTNAVIMLSIGLLGEYLALALNSVRNRPKYVILDCPHSRFM